MTPEDRAYFDHKEAKVRASRPYYEPDDREWVVVFRSRDQTANIALGKFTILEMEQTVEDWCARNGIKTASRWAVFRFSSEDDALLTFMKFA